MYTSRFKQFQFVILFFFITIGRIQGKLKLCSELDYEFYEFNNDTNFDNFAEIIIETEDKPAICDVSNITAYNKDVAPSYPMELDLKLFIYDITNVDDQAYTISVSLSLGIIKPFSLILVQV